MDAMLKLNKKEEIVSIHNEIRYEGQDKDFDACFNWEQWKSSVKKAEEGSFLLSLDYKIEEVRELALSPASLKFIEIQEFLSPSPKPLEEVKGMIVSLYQNYLEEEWIKTLRSNNKVWVNKDAILSLIKK